MLAVVIVATAAQLSFSDLFAPDDGGLRPSARAEALAGKRVRIQGFMARLEIPPKGAFLLCRTPLDLDEGGAGTGDLPVESILVVLTPASAEPVPTLRGPLSVVGTFEVGRKVAADGTISLFRVVLDPHRGKAARRRMRKEKQR